MNPHAATWDVIRCLLREARSCLAPESNGQERSAVVTGALSGTLSEFEEFLDHNELALAWDALADVAERTNAPAVCWHSLARAASLMDLPDKEKRAATRAKPGIASDQALAVANADAARAYHDLLPYRIQLALEADGWHVDYELNKPNLHGGGPHYVIDANTGAILSKSYEQ